MNVCYPVLSKFAITSQYGARNASKSTHGQSSSWHKGIDLDVLTDTNADWVVSCTDGVVQYVGETYYRGKLVFVTNTDGGGCLYQHLASINVSVGDKVYCKSKLGIMGNTGNVTKKSNSVTSGKHLHFEVTSQTTYQGLISNGGQFNPALFWGIEDYYNLTGKVFDGSGMISGKSAGQISTNKSTSSSSTSSSTTTTTTQTATSSSGLIDIISSGEYYEIKDLTGATSDWLYGRRYRCIVDLGNNQAFDVSELRCEFNIEKTAYPLASQSTISIYNLNPDDENKLIKSGQRIIIEAGYNGDQYGKIFEGNIIQPLRSKENGVDYKLTLVSMDSDRFVTYGLIGVSLTAQETARSAVEALAARTGNVTGSNYGMTIGVLADQRIDYPRGKVMFGSPTQYLTQIAKSMNASYYNDDGTVNIISPSELADDEIFDLSPDTGLIGTPTQNEYGISCRCLLNPRLKLNSLFRIDNSRVTNMKYTQGQAIRSLDSSGIYRVIKISYKGDTRGDTWECEVDAISQAGALPAMALGDSIYIY